MKGYPPYYVMEDGRAISASAKAGSSSLKNYFAGKSDAFTEQECHEQGIKTVLIVRNPVDRLQSMFNISGFSQKAFWHRITTEETNPHYLAQTDQHDTWDDIIRLEDITRLFPDFPWINKSETELELDYGAHNFHEYIKRDQKVWEAAWQ